jgi:hypothetical protein
MVTGEDGLRTMELVEKLTESAAEAGQNSFSHNQL